MISTSQTTYTKKQANVVVYWWGGHKFS